MAVQDMQWTKEFTLFLKGLAIFMIVGHNFFHWVGPDSVFNEMTFNYECVESLLSQYKNHPFELINTTFDYFGHFGVQVFIFISGVGLARAYGGARRGGTGSFLATRITKIYLSLLLAFAFYLLSVWRLEAQVLWDMVPFLFFIQNFVPGKLFAINGPWWFFSLIVQLYILFPLIYKVIERYRRDGAVALLVISYLAIFGLQDAFRRHDLFIFATFFGHLPEFVLGIACAVTGRIVFRGKYCLLAALIFCLANIDERLFPFQFIAATYVLVYLMLRLYAWKSSSPARRYCFAAVERLGGISLAVFAVNGFLRVPLTTIADAHQYSPLSLALFVAFFVIVLAVAGLYTFIFNRMLRLAKTVGVPGLKSLGVAG